MHLMPTAGSRQPAALRGFTLVEMLIAMAITLVMMGAVVTLFANVSGSVRNRRATAEMAGQVRHVRNVMQQDLQGATCPGLPWQRPESNHGYIELIEGIATDQNPTPMVRDLDSDGKLETGESKIDPSLSFIPRNNIGIDADGNGKITVQEREAHHQNAGSLVPGGLGDYDDILMLTVRNEHEPFVGRMPANVRVLNGLITFDKWGEQTIESTLAEVIWFAVENPGHPNPAVTGDDPSANNFFGEPGMRTIYRRTLLIAPWINPYHFVGPRGAVDTFNDGGQTFKAQPGFVRLLPDRITVDQAIAAIIAFQDRYDLSVRLEWDHNIGNAGRWKIMANTLGDLTKRENRFGHYGFLPASGSGTDSTRIFPYAMVSYGSGYSGTSADVAFVSDPEVSGVTDSAQATANFQDSPTLDGLVESYSVPPANFDPPTANNRRYTVRPFAYVDDTPAGVPATANAMLNDQGQVVRVVYGPVPLWGTRRGEDVMLTGALAFDLRLYDPGAPLYLENSTETMLEPLDPGWKRAYHQQLGNAQSGATFMGQGAYVDMGYVISADPTFELPMPSAGVSLIEPWFSNARSLIDVFGNQLAPGYAVYDTWSFHYENNGVDEDADGLIDEGTNNLDEPDPRLGGAVDVVDHVSDVPVLGVDDTGERETVPPYDKPLRGLQVLMRVYEPDSRAIRQVRINQHFMPE